MIYGTDALSYESSFSELFWLLDSPDSKVRGANVGPTWGRQDPGGPHVAPMKFAIWVSNRRRIN